MFSGFQYTTVLTMPVVTYLSSCAATFSVPDSPVSFGTHENAKAATINMASTRIPTRFLLNMFLRPPMFQSVNLMTSEPLLAPLSARGLGLMLYK